MSTYPSKLEVFKQFTIGLSKLSKCTKRQVAAVITDTELQNVYGLGINGGPKGLHDCLCVDNQKYGCCHAEINALTKCNSVEHGKIMLMTLSPCSLCATAMINAPGSFKTVYYFEEWRDNTGILLLNKAGIYTVLL